MQQRSKCSGPDARPTLVADPSLGVVTMKVQRVLVVDDEDFARRVTSEMIRGAGFIVDEACNGCDALKLARNQCYAAVVVDLFMPGMNGTDFVGALRSVLPGVRPIVVSGYLSDESRTSVKHLDLTACLAKPLNKEQLLAAVVSSTRHAPPPTVA